MGDHTMPTNVEVSAVDEIYETSLMLTRLSEYFLPNDEAEQERLGM